MTGFIVLNYLGAFFVWATLKNWQHLTKANDTGILQRMIHIHAHPLLVKTVLLAFITIGIFSSISSGQNPLPLLNEREFNIDQKLFFADYNGYQPNIMSIQPTQQLVAFIEKVKRANKDIDWNNMQSVTIFLTRAVSEYNRSTDDKKSNRLFEVCEGCATGRNHTRRPFCKSSCACLERSVALASALAYIGLKPSVLFTSTVFFDHAFVAVIVNDRMLFLDPLINYASNNLIEYLHMLSKDTGVSTDTLWKLYPAVPYRPEYPMYAGKDAEEALSDHFAWIKTEVRLK